MPSRASKNRVRQANATGYRSTSKQSSSAANVKMPMLVLKPRTNKLTETHAVGASAAGIAAEGVRLVK